MAIAAASSFSVGSSQCHLCQVEGAYYSPLVGVNNGWIRHTFDGCKVTDSPGISVRCRNLFFGSTQFHWLSMGRDLSLSKVLVAADYSDSVPNPSSYESNQGYHPLEELKVSKRIQEIQLSSAEIARTTVENVLIGMDIPVRENNQAVGDFNHSDIGIDDEVPFDDEYFEAVHVEHDRKMDHPSNGVSIVGCLRPAFADEESYLRRLFHFDYDEGYTSDWKDGEAPKPSSKYGGSKSGSILYRLEIMQIELFSVYGAQSLISLKDFQDAEPDVLVHSTSAILERFSEKGIWCNVALKSLCKKKGLQIEEANLIGVDSLGIDVRIFSGVEVRTCRFPFKIRAMSEAAAEKKIRQLLFPRSRRKKFQSHGYELRDPGS
ncbi:hypothetical protein ERO13_D05G326200v2 [Gossypium hirsutum]|uniref:Uncharacterized protein isoform X4 n=1 Tax=Gossypium hirsutum TaxID=3635 RepID=A0ABM3A115_GOSHI|nr:uncharacterized protein LOC107903896 isoform X4 [Gossypium hirsutum]KAG4149189.1 hypothetical protein ERO13_D05G326200v2 [Gossypium hirsutum]